MLTSWESFETLKISQEVNVSDRLGKKGFTINLTQLSFVCGLSACFYPFTLFLTMFVIHQNAKANSLNVKTYLAINSILVC